MLLDWIDLDKGNFQWLTSEIVNEFGCWCVNVILVEKRRNVVACVNSIFVYLHAVMLVISQNYCVKGAINYKFLTTLKTEIFQLNIW